MRAASCFSGIGAAELALPEADWLWSAEVDPFANAVREQRLNDNNLSAQQGVLAA
jgi:site-specific DNA-cytosine methylase